MLKRQLIGVYIFALFVPILLVGSILIYYNYSMIYGHHREMLSSDNIRVRSVVFETTTSIVNISDAISDDKELGQLVSKQYTDSDDVKDTLEKFELLNDFYNRYTEISTINIYTDNNSLYSYGHVNIIDETNNAWFYEHVDRPGYYWQTFEGRNQFDNSYEELQLIHAITIPNSDYDVLLVINISNNYLKNRIDNNSLDVDITVNQDPAFFSTWGFSGQQIQYDSYNDEEFYKYSGITEYLGEKSLIEVSTIKPLKTSDSIYIFSKDPTALEEIKRILLIMILIIVMSIILPLLVIIKYTNQLTNRVQTLRTEMHRVTSGDYNIIETFKGNDELVDLFTDLKSMIRSIEERDQAIYKAQIKEQQLFNHQQKIELELLSSKINPHFLYNTLETIRMKAFNSDALEVAQSVKLLGRYMRYNLESTGELTKLSSEISYMQVYLNIQNLRFSDRITYKINIEEGIDLEEISILPLLIQPIVENAFKHGHEETIEDGIIEINISDVNKNILISVRDNGKGIEEKELVKLVESFTNGNLSDKSSFGLYNIHQRLKLFYGDEFGLQIRSKLDVGTVIEFEIPQKL